MITLLLMINFEPTKTQNCYMDRLVCKRYVNKKNHLIVTVYFPINDIFLWFCKKKKIV